MSLGWIGNCWQLREDLYLLAIDNERYHSRMLPSVLTIVATVYGRCCVIMRLRGFGEATVDDPGADQSAGAKA
jgi:hypothetical protein